MLYFKKSLLAFCLIVLSSVAFAGYAQLKPPAGWSPAKSGATTATFRTGPAANENTYKGSTVLTNAALNIAGQVIVVPVSMRIASNAASTAATFAFGNPLAFAAIGIASAAYQYYQGQGLVVDNGAWAKVKVGCSVEPCFEYKFDASGGDGGTFNAGWFPTTESAAKATVAMLPSLDGKYSYVYISCNPNGNNTDCIYRIKTRSYVNEGFSNQTTEYSTRNNLGTIYKRALIPSSPEKLPVGDIEFHTIMDPISVPTGVPKDLPDVDFPVEQPAINPSPSNIPNTSPSPFPAPDSVPIWVPTGDPVKNSNSDPGTKPDTWTQPGKDIKPAGTPSDPWRVDVTDAPKTKNDPSPNIDTPTPATKTPTPQEIVTCGLPGKPKCQIDELDTPKPDPLIDGKKAADEALSKLKDFSADPEKALPPLPSLNWAFRLPTGCTPLSITAFAPFLQTIDICQFQPMFHDIMSMVWTIGGLFGAIGLFWRNTLSQS